MLSKKAKYAIIALKHLARRYKEGPVQVGDIADKQRIPKKFLHSILAELGKAGLLASRRGKGGGYYLIKPPQDIDLAQVVRLTDGAIALLPCVTYRFYEPCEECRDEETCTIRMAMKEVRDATVEALKNQSITRPHRPRPL